MEEQGWLDSGDNSRVARTAYAITRLPTRQMVVIKPYVELLTDYLQRNF